MGLSFLPEYIKNAVLNLNYNLLSEIRLRQFQPVIVEYRGEYVYLTPYGVSENKNKAVICKDVEQVLSNAVGGYIYGYTEQLKKGFITVNHGVRIGIAGEYVCEKGQVQTVKNVTSLNIRLPHNVLGCSEFLFKSIFAQSLPSVLIFSKAGYGKTTLLRDIALNLSNRTNLNILILDERSEISAMDGEGNGYDLGDRIDVVRCNNKIDSIYNAMRAMKPQVLITDELYGEDDISAIKYAMSCGVTAIASSHVSQKSILKKMPFEYYVELTGIGKSPIVYDKNFNTY